MQRRAPRSRLRALLFQLGFLTLIHPSSPAFATDPGATTTQDAAEQDEFRQRLTEREDKLRLAQPWHIDIAGRPLTVSGEAGFELEQRRRPTSGAASARDVSRVLEMEAEAFYDIDARFALFAQLRIAQERQPSTIAERSLTRYAERGEMWVYAKSIGGSALNLEFGRLNFEDERRWWWDRKLDAARMSYEGKDIEFALAFARELGRTRTDREGVEPEQDRVRRRIAYAAWDWTPALVLNMFALRHDDRSSRELAGQLVVLSRQDESDARLDWFGLGVAGELKLRGGVVSYEIDAASVRGYEQLAEFDSASSNAVAVSGVIRRNVRGRAFDGVVRWTGSGAIAPRVYFGFAYGSGGAGADGTDQSFRQTGLHVNEASFGGVKRFAHYGTALDPELSNLRIATAGAGLSPVTDSSIDLVAHRYRLVAPATSLRAARIATELSGPDRDIGWGIDLAAAIKVLGRVEFNAIASTFRSSTAFGERAGRTHTFGTVGVRVAF